MDYFIEDSKAEKLTVKQEISLDTLKSSTIQLFLKVDPNFSE
jgi:hypothetical protein